MTQMKLGVVAVLVLGAVGAATACSSTVRNNVFEDDAGADATPGGNTTDGPILFDPDSSPTTGCPEGSETRITGKVFDPAGKNPLYNIQVYIPGGELPPIKVGLPDPPGGDAICAGQTCDSEVQNPLAATLTNTKGEFELKGPRVFAGKDVPLVMQIGKWRRKIVIPEVKACQENKIAVADSRLPKNGREGDMPQIMMVLGDYDALECLLSGIGIDNDEFEAGYTSPTKHIHVVRGIGGGARVNGQPVPDVRDTWDQGYKMQKFDIAMLSCEGTPDATNKPSSFNSMRDYTTVFGGRVFATHYHAQWAYRSGWGEAVVRSSGGTTGSNPYPVNTSFPKGQAFADWLVNVGASTTPGKIQLSDPSSYQGGLAPVPAGQPARGLEWIGTGSSAKYISFNTPIDVPPAKQCGRFVISDVHAAGGGSGGEDLPRSCPGLNAQLAALEFMFFDLSSCVQDETKPPEPPK
jgi:hypothetical protein